MNASSEFKRPLNIMMALAAVCFIATVGVMYLRTIYSGSFAPWLPVGAIAVAVVPVAVFAMMKDRCWVYSAIMAAAITASAAIWGMADAWMMLLGLFAMLLGFTLALAAAVLAAFIRSRLFRAQEPGNWAATVLTCYLFIMSAMNFVSLESQSFMPRMLAAEGRLALVLAVLVLAWRTGKCLITRSAGAIFEAKRKI